MKDEITMFRNILEENITALQALDILKKSNTSFSNIYIALRIMLTIPITSAGAERSFSKLKLIQNYLCSTITQERLSALSIIAIEIDLVETLSDDEITNRFSTEKATKKFFNNSLRFLIVFYKLKNSLVVKKKKNYTRSRKLFRRHCCQG